MYKVLIVDDERIIREGMKKVIPWKDLDIDQVFTAVSGDEALKIIEREMPQIMITDINMSKMTGLELIEKVLEIQPDMRILVLTGYDSFEYARECLRLRVQDFLLKPIDEAVLSESVRKQVEAIREQELERKYENMHIRAEGTSVQIGLEQTLNDLIHGSNKDEALKTLMEDFSMKPDMRLMVVLLIPNLDIGYGQRDNDVKFRLMENLCLEFIDMKGLGITVRDRGIGQALFMVLYVEKCDKDSDDLISSLLEIIKNEFGSVPRAAIGNEVTGFKNLDISYHDALYLLQNEQNNAPVILQNKNVIRQRHMFLEVYEELKKEMCANITDFSFLMHAYDSFCAATKSYNLSAASIREYCFELLADICFCYNVNGGSGRELHLESLLSSLTGINGDTCLEIGRQYLVNMLGGEEKDIHEIVGQAKRYINAHLADELSVGNLAERFFVSPNYFSRLFKKVTGQGCNEYIVQKRIEKACLLLETTNLNTGKIAAMVGYNDTNYFSMTFKKHCGVSPTQYRSRVRAKEENQ